MTAYPIHLDMDPDGARALGSALFDLNRRRAAAGHVPDVGWGELARRLAFIARGLGDPWTDGPFRLTSDPLGLRSESPDTALTDDPDWDAEGPAADLLARLEAAAAILNGTFVDDVAAVDTANPAGVYLVVTPFEFAGYPGDAIIVGPDYYGADPGDLRLEVMGPDQTLESAPRIIGGAAGEPATRIAGEVFAAIADLGGVGAR